MRFLLALITIVSFGTLAGEYGCSRWDTICVLSPTPPNDGPPGTAPRSIDPGEGDVAAISRLSVKERSYRLGLASSIDIVGTTASRPMVIDRLGVSRGEVALTEDPEGAFVVAGLSPDEETAQIVLYVLAGGLVKRTFDLECAGRPFGSVDITNVAFNLDQRTLSFDADMPCDDRVHFGSATFQTIGRRNTLVARLDEELFVADIADTDILRQRESNTLRLAESAELYTECTAMGPTILAERYPTVETGVFYCFRFDSYAEFDTRFGTMTGGEQTISAYRMNPERVTKILEHSFRAPGDSALFYPGIGVRPGMAFDAGSRIALIGDHGGTGDSRSLHLLLGGEGYLFDFTIVCDCGRLWGERNFRYNAETRTLTMVVETDATVLTIDRARFDVGETDRFRDEGGEKAPSREVAIGIRFGEDGGIISATATAS